MPMGVIAETAQRRGRDVCGKVVEEAPVEEIFRAPRHPYRKGSSSRSRASTKRYAQAARPIAGTVPSLLNPAEGCRFAARCTYVPTNAA